MKAVESFFLVCSGAQKSILKRTPTEKNRYVGIGATIFFTGVFACIAAAYALYTVFDSYAISIVFGLFWGLMIFNLDRYIVSTMKKKGRFFQDIKMAFPRLILAVLIAVIIAKPLELKIFDSEIQSEIMLMQQENKKSQEDILRSRYASDMARLNNEIAVLKTEIATKTNTRDQLISQAIIEADGTGGSMKRNMGPIYEAKKAEADKVEAETLLLINTNQPLIEQKQAQLLDIEESMQTELEALQLASLSGFAARMEALSRLGRKSPAIFWASIFIMLLFIAIETAPIFVKLMTQRSPYDYVLDKHEFQFAMNHKSITTLLENATQNRLDFELETTRHKTQIAIEAEKEISKKALLDHLEGIKNEPLVWKDLLRKGKLFQFD